MVIFPIVNGAPREIIGVAVAFIVLPCVAVALRVYGRHRKGVPFDRSDYLIFCGLVSFPSISCDDQADDPELSSIAFSSLDISCMPPRNEQPRQR
jgi:hypothetical protein